MHLIYLSIFRLRKIEMQRQLLLNLDNHFHPGLSWVKDVVPLSCDPNVLGSGQILLDGKAIARYTRLEVAPPSALLDAKFMEQLQIAREITPCVQQFYGVARGFLRWAGKDLPSSFDAKSSPERREAPHGTVVLVEADPPEVGEGLRVWARGESVSRRQIISLAAQLHYTMIQLKKIGVNPNPENILTSRVVYLPEGAEFTVADRKIRTFGVSLWIPCLGLKLFKPDERLDDPAIYLRTLKSLRGISGKRGLPLPDLESRDFYPDFLEAYSKLEPDLLVSSSIE